MDTIGEKIKNQRIKSHISQQELAGKAKISNTFLCDIEKGRAKPSIPTLIRIANALNISDINFFLTTNYVNTEKKIIIV